MIIFDKLCKKVASAIGALKHVRSFITMDASIHIYQGLISTIAARYGMGRSWRDTEY